MQNRLEYYKNRYREHKEIMKSQMRKNYQIHRDERIAYQKMYRSIEQNRKKINDSKKARRRRAIDICGGKCIYCGENQKEFLRLFTPSNSPLRNCRTQPKRISMILNRADPQGCIVLCSNCLMTKHSCRRTHDNINKKFLSILELYGNECACCGEKRRELLTLDHIREDAKTTDRQYRCGNDYGYRNALMNFDKESYQILCFNCNFAKSLNDGICPHKQK